MNRVEMLLTFLGNNKDGITLIFLSIGGIFAVYQYKQNNVFERLKQTPIITIRMSYESLIGKKDVDIASGFNFKFVDMEKEQHEDYYLYKNLDELKKNVKEYISINLVTSQENIAYNTWLTVQKDKPSNKNLFGKNSHYSINQKNANNDEYYSGEICFSQEEYRKIIGKKIFVTYQNKYHEKFVDEFNICKNGKIVKLDSYHLKSYFFNMIVVRNKI